MIGRGGINTAALENAAVKSGRFDKARQSFIGLYGPSAAPDATELRRGNARNPDMREWLLAAN